VDGNTNTGLSLARRLHPKYSPAFDKLNERDRAAVAFYFLPHAVRAGAAGGASKSLHDRHAVDQEPGRAYG